MLNFYTSCEVKRGLSFSYIIYRIKESKEVNKSEIYNSVTNPAYGSGIFTLPCCIAVDVTLHEVFVFVQGIYKRTWNGFLALSNRSCMYRK
jgi:hypothetical protein